MHLSRPHSLRWGIRYSCLGLLISEGICIRVSVAWRFFLLFIVILWRCSSWNSLYWRITCGWLSVLIYRLVRAPGCPKSWIVLFFISIVAPVWTLIHLWVVLRVYWTWLWLFSIIIPTWFLFPLAIKISLALDVPSRTCLGWWLVLLRRLLLCHWSSSCRFVAGTKSHVIHLINIRLVLCIVIDLRFKYFSVIFVCVRSISAVVSRVSSCRAIFI